MTAGGGSNISWAWSHEWDRNRVSPVLPINTSWAWSHEWDRNWEDWDWDVVGAEVNVICHSWFICNKVDDCGSFKVHRGLHETCMTAHDVPSRHDSIVAFYGRWVLRIQRGQMAPLAS